MTAYPHLFSPVRVGNVTVRNRVAHSPTVTLFSLSGVDTRRNLDYNVALAGGGVGLIVAGNRLVHPLSTTGMFRYAWGYLPDAVAVDRELTAAVHEHGAAIFAQLNFFGLNASSDSADDLRVLWAPSPVKSPSYGETPKQMEPEELAEVADWWARSAELQREAGFDGVEVHMAHTYLLHQFLSPVFNKRTDEYGGSFDARARFPLQVIGEVRRRVGRDFAVGVRLSLSDFMEGGLELEDAVRLARLLEAADVDYVSVTGAGYHNSHLEERPSDASEDGWLVEMTATLKAAVPGLAVFAGGGLRRPEHAEEILAAGKADLVTMSRALIADPEWARKAQEGRESEIYRCIRCNQACIGRVYRSFPIGCTVNPLTGRSRKFGDGALAPSASPGRWLVVGGGPAGLKAAETLARRGHRVTLLEREDRLGGQVSLILRTPGREPFAAVVEDLEASLARLDVEIRLGTEASAELVRGQAADGVILATGALPTSTGFSTGAPLLERVPGVEQENVLTVWDVLRGERPAGGRVVVLDDDGTRFASGTVEVLTARGCDVTVVTRFSALFPTTAITLDQPVVYGRLFEQGLAFHLNSWARAIEGRTVRVFNLYGGPETALEDVDAVVLATGPQADDRLYHELKGTIERLHRIGDCVAPRRLDHAIYEGFLAGCELWTPAERYVTEGDLERAIVAGAGGRRPPSP